jgi:ABC-2 type transport system permease protein
MLEFARFEGRQRVRGAAVLTVALAAFAALYVAVYPSMAASIDLDQLIAAYPEPLLKAFGVESLATMEGFLASELYTFGWLLLLGLYFAYAAAGLVADDVERGRMDVLLSLPVTRAQVVFEKYASLAVPLVFVNVVMPVVVYVGARLVDHPVAAEPIVVMHAFSIPYLLACAGIGLALSVAVSRTSIAQKAALGVVFGLFLVESLVADTDFEPLGAISPARYVDPNAILVDGSYDVAGAAILLVAAAALVAASARWFARRDV